MRKSKFNVTTTAEFISEATKIHNGKYAYEKSVFTTVSKPIIVTCLKHGDWNQVARSHLLGHGCFKCMREALENKYKVTNDNVDKLLLDRNKNFKRIGEYVGTRNPIEFECLKCSFRWFSTVDYVKHNKHCADNCPKCYKSSVTHSNQHIDDLLVKKNIKIKRISDYINHDTKIMWQCLECAHQWLYTPKHITSNNKKCSVCIGTHHNNKYIDDKLIEQNRNIKRIGEYTRMDTKLDWQCINCNHVWQTRPNLIIGPYQVGCPECTPHLKNQTCAKNAIQNLNIKIEKLVIKLNNRKLYPDFYLPDYNLIIELNGGQHFFPVRFGNMSDEKMNNNFKKQQIRDQLLRDYCAANNINLLEIDGRKYQNNKLIKFINNYFANLELSPLPFPPKPLIPSSELQII